MGAFLAPVFLILVINVVVFIWVITVVIRHARKKAARMDKVNCVMNNKQILHIIITISGVLFLFCLSWLLFVLTFSVPGLQETFQILFTVFNSLQGFFVFKLPLSYSQKALTIGRPSYHVRSTNPSIFMMYSRLSLIWMGP